MTVDDGDVLTVDDGADRTADRAPAIVADLTR